MAQRNKAENTSYVRWLMVLVLAVLWCVAGSLGWLQFLENKLLDFRYFWRGEIVAPVKLVYVDVDTRAIEKMGERPWGRGLYANVAEAVLLAGKARAVGFDFVLSEISSSGLVDKARAQEGNDELSRVLGEYPMKIALAAQYTTGESRILAGEKGRRNLPLRRLGMTDPAKNDAPETPMLQFTLDPKKRTPISRIGLIDVDVVYSGDDIPRWVPLFTETRFVTYYHLSLQLVLQYLGLSERAIRRDEDRINLVGDDGAVVRSIPLHLGQLLETNWFSHWKSTQNARVSLADVLIAIAADSETDPKRLAEVDKFFAQFEDAIVLIGPVDEILQDLAPTPFDSHPVPKVGLHGNLIKTILSGEYIKRPPAWSTWVIVVTLTVLVSALAMAQGKRGWFGKVLCIVGPLAAYALLAVVLFTQRHLVLPMGVPLVSAFTTSFIAVIWQLVLEEKAKARVQGMFGTYVSPQLVERMVESGEDPELGGDDREITAYFSDIQGFSKFSEMLNSRQLVELLNEYLTACTDIVQEYDGTLDKFIGDAVVAMYGAPIKLEPHAFRACLTSQLVHLRLGELRAKWRSEGDKWPQIVWNMQTRIGLNSGPCTIGNMGSLGTERSRPRFNYTMMGDNVNLAARMESQAKGWGVYTMVTEDTKVACARHDGGRIVFRHLGSIQVMGRSQAVPVHEIVGLKENVAQSTHECVGLFEQGLAKLHQRDWDGAIALFEKSNRLEPNQPGKTPGVKLNPSLARIEHVEKYKHEPPPDDWDGRYVATDK